MKKKEYQKPAMRVVLRHHQARLLVGSKSSVQAGRTSYGTANYELEESDYNWE